MLKTPKKPPKQVYKDYYQRNKETKKAKRKERYAKQKEQEQLLAQKHYQANSIKVLLSLKEYTELNREKMKLWYDFMWTIQDCQKSGFFDIIQIQQLEQLAGNLTRDYYQTAKSKSESNWNSLSEEEKSKLIKYLARENARKEQDLTDKLADQERIGETLEKELDLAKFHEERGKIKCSCYDCENKKEIQAEIKEKMLNGDERKLEKEQCSECQKWVKKVDEENEICKSCVKKYEE